MKMTWFRGYEIGTERARGFTNVFERLVASGTAPMPTRTSRPLRVPGPSVRMP